MSQDVNDGTNRCRIVRFPNLLCGFVDEGSRSSVEARNRATTANVSQRSFSHREFVHAVTWPKIVNSAVSGSACSLRSCRSGSLLRRRGRRRAGYFLGRRKLRPWQVGWSAEGGNL